MILFPCFLKPPGTAESQALTFSAQDCGDLGSSPGISMMDVSESMLLPVGFPSFDSFNTSPPPVAMEDSLSKQQEQTKNITAQVQVNCSQVVPSNEFDHLIKDEALMTFAPEYGAIETPSIEISSSIFRSPYIPKSRKAETENSSSNNYVYSATPPSSPCVDDSEQKSGTCANARISSGKPEAISALQSKKYYLHVENGIGKSDRRIPNCNDETAAYEPLAAISTFCGSNSTSAVKSGQIKASDLPLRTENFLPSLKTVLATEIECLMCQAFMCRIRHTTSSSSSPLPVGLSRMSGSGVSQPHLDSSLMTDHISRQSEMRKKESIPVRIAGDIDSGMLDGPLSSPVGVWRPVGVPKGAKSTASNIEVCPSMPHNSFVEESILSYGLRQPLQEFLDGLVFLVQQATSFVDVALDADCGDGPYGWLALQEQWRRGFSCGPSMVHAGCGGVLSSSHSVDIAGVELADPLSIDVSIFLNAFVKRISIKFIINKFRCF